MIKKILSSLVLFCVYSLMYAQIWPSSTVGRWTFDNNANPLQATIGNDLTLHGTHTLVPGPTSNDGAISINTGSYYICSHGIAANGGGSLVNEYSLLFDIMIDNPKVYHCLYQTNVNNSNDGEVFINPHSQLGISGTGYTGFSLKAKKWYRIVISVDLGSSFKYYIDGKLVLNGISQSIDGRYSLDPTVLFFADDNGEDNLIYCSQIAIFNTALTPTEVSLLGGFRSSNITPFLQTPSPTSIFISWNSYNSSSTQVQFGTTPNLGTSTSGAYQDIGLSPNINRWHTVKLTSLLPDTRYYYRCISGDDTSATYHFRTPPAEGSTGKHIRIVKVGDSQTHTITSTMIYDTIAYKLKELYGEEWADSVSLIIHTGDIVENGSDLGRYMNEFFNPLSSLSPYIPTMISIGNHEGENAYYYQFVKYEDLEGFNERYYSFILSNCQFISLNTNGLYNSSIQTNWLQNQLDASNNNPLIDFVFTFNHQPGHSEIWPDGNDNYVLNSLYPLQASYPKMVMTTHGHSHNYERGTIEGTHSENWGFYEVLSGGAGGALDRWGMYQNQTDYPEIQKSFDHYNFLIIDVNTTTKSVFATTYSLGHTDLPRNLEIIDRWHRIANQPRPDKPETIYPISFSEPQPTLIASEFSGVDTLMSSHFQLIQSDGSFDNPLLDVLRDFENFYEDSGPPLYNGINQNESIDLKTLVVPDGLLNINETYRWRMRYRDRNLRWSDWSDTAEFIVTEYGWSEIPLNKNNIILYPNPAQDFIYIKVINENLKPKSIIINDLSGRLMLNYEFPEKKNIYKINIQNLVQGIYLLMTIDEENTIINKELIIKFP